jgi:CheY-like chemotaxis protein
MDAKPIEILLAEDNDDDILLIEEALSDSRLLNLMKVARDGAQALAYLRREGEFKGARMPGLVLLDVNMPKKNGLEALQEIKADPELRHLPVVMMTVSERDEDIIKSFSYGACSYIKKPVDFEKLKEVVKNFELYWTLVSKIPERR